MKNILLTVLIGFVSLSNSFGQRSQTLYHMKRIPQISQMNPALQPECNFYLNLPGISDVNLGMGNNSLTYRNFIRKSHDNDSLVTFLHPDHKPYLDDFLKALNPSNAIFTRFSTTLLGFGFRASNHYISFHVREKSNFKFSFPGDVGKLFLTGNKTFKGENIEFRHFDLYSNHHLEYALGFSGKMYGKLTYGIRAKYLQGLVNLKSRDFDLLFKLNEAGDTLRLKSDIDIRGSGPVELSDSLDNIGELEIPDLTINNLFANPGFALDIGASYEVNEQLQISASIIDLGLINYSSQFAHNYTITNDEPFMFSGLEITSQEEDTDDENFNVFSGDMASLGEQMIDSLEGQTKRDHSEQGFIYFLGPKIYLGGNYALTSNFDVGFLSRTGFFGGDVNQSFTLSANARPINGISLSASYSVMNRAFNNLGLGVGLRLGPLQLYTISDIASAGLWPGNTRAFNLRLGLNFVFGCNKQNRILGDEPMIR